jgi:ribose transport system ATP-binding protein
MTEDRASGPAIEAANISKRFGAVTALHDATFRADFGEVHALVGENGAGKSTMIKTLCGMLQPDSGTVRLEGREMRLRNPEAALERGIGAVFQELTLLPWMTVAENLLIRREPRRAKLVRRRDLVPQAERLLEEYDVTSIDPRGLVAGLSLSQRQVLEVVRTVSRAPRILFLDEPTSSLAERETEWLFGLVRRLREDGVCLVFTSHRWREVNALADRVTIFRGGREVETRDRFDEDEAIRLMTGRSSGAPAAELSPIDRAEPVLEVSGLRAGGLDDVSLTVHRGEIVGVGGLEGQGQRELFLALFGVERSGSGAQVRVGDRTVRLRSPRDAIRAGVALVPEDRKGEGLLLPMSVKENLTLAVLGALTRLGFVRLPTERHRARDMMSQLQVRARDYAQAVSGLSGGNQQKALIGRWLLTDADVLLLYDITRGVDIATKQDLYQLMTDLAAEGKAILYYSSDTEEVAQHAHRVVVMRDGRMVAELEGPGIDPEAIVGAAVREEVTQP